VLVSLNLSLSDVICYSNTKQRVKDERCVYRDWSDMNAGTTSVLTVHSYEIAASQQTINCC